MALLYQLDRTQTNTYIEDVIVHILVLLQVKDVVLLRFGGFGGRDLSAVIRRGLPSLRHKSET